MPKAVETVVFNGIRFRRYPDSDRREARDYFVPGGLCRKRGIGRLHQEVWKAAHGDIPAGHHIHHIDGNTLNNAVENLECKLAHDHLSDHGEYPTWLQEPAVRAEAIRRATIWHRSPEGRAWHSEHGRQAWSDREPTAHICDQCGAAFNAFDVGSRARFCSNNCKSAWRRASGVDNEQRVCDGCGESFSVNRYMDTRCCSRKCAWVVRRRLR